MVPWADLQLRAAADPPKVFAQARAERRRIVMRRQAVDKVSTA